MRALLLRGRLGAWWTSRRARQWEKAYCRELLKQTTSRARPIVPQAVITSGSLRRILFIADCMWELRDLVPELRRIAEVSVLDLSPKLKSKSASQPSSEVVSFIISEFGVSQKSLVPDVVIFYGRPALLSEAVFHCLRKLWTCPLFGMNLDDRFEFFDYGVFSGVMDGYHHWAKQFDLNITNCLPAVDWYRQRGLHCVYSPQGFHPPDNAQLPISCEFKYQFGFVGMRKPERESIINELLARGVPIQLWGTGWPGAKWVDDPAALHRNTQINLGIGFASPSLTLTTVKNRDFECPGAGACYLTTYNWELANLYEIGKEILCYRSVEELIELYTYYRDRPEQCLKIAQAAWRRCVNEHTWEKRFRKIFEYAGFRV